MPIKKRRAKIWIVILEGKIEAVSLEKPYMSDAITKLSKLAGQENPIRRLEMEY
jgi:hypothetical protein